MAVRTEHARGLERPPAGPSAIVWAPAVAAVVALGLLVRLVEPTRVGWVRTLAIVFGSLVVEAMPFVVLGAVVSAAIEVLAPASAFARIGRLPRWLQLPAAAVAGVAFPVCECGSIPVARRLLAKGLAPSAAVAFMLAAPIVNPVVIASTAVAYRGRDVWAVMVAGRVGIGLVVAIAAGWVLGAATPGELLRGRIDLDEVRGEPRWRRFFGHLAGDVVFMGRFLLLGALIAAAVQTFVPQTLAGGLARTPIVGLVAMMTLAYVMSLCSESDAFVAASFVAFGPAAQLAFLVFGPMVDTKLTALYIGAFGRSTFRTLLVVVSATTLVASLWVEVFVG
ncbi:MAG: permease [Actinomycetota bacterium]|jgi:uncharacterized membrane protein YraQ (UPF0718 family)|nr:MAG: permease [Actinomycetota bacterium]